MSTILIAALGSLGDLFPYLALGRGLRAAGHAVIIATSTPYQAYVEAEDCIFFAMRPHPPDNLAEVYAKILDDKNGVAFLIRDILLGNIRDTYADLLAAIEQYRCDVFINGFTVYAAPPVAETTGICWISTVLAPMIFASAFEPPAIVGLPQFLVPGPAALRPWWGTVLQAYAKNLTRSWAAPVDALRAELKLAPALQHPLFEGQYSPAGVLALFSQTLGAPQADWPAKVTQTGFLLYSQAANDSEQAELRRFLESGKPPIVFALGSTAVHAGADFYALSFRAVERLNERAVFLIGSDEKNRASFPPVLPPHIYVQAFAPYATVFPSASLVVHQGGVGTTAEAMRAGVPQIIVPFNFDQADNALRMVTAGAGRTIPLAKYTVASAVSALRKVSADAAMQSSAKGIAVKIRSENGVANAVAAIESMYAEQRRGPSGAQ